MHSYLTDRNIVILEKIFKTFSLSMCMFTQLNIFWGPGIIHNSESILRYLHSNLTNSSTVDRPREKDFKAFSYYISTLNFEPLFGPKYWSGDHDLNNFKLSQYIQALMKILAFPVRWLLRRRNFKTPPNIHTFAIISLLKGLCPSFLQFSISSPTSFFFLSLVSYDTKDTR